MIFTIVRRFMDEAETPPVDLKTPNMPMATLSVVLVVLVLALIYFLLKKRRQRQVKALQTGGRAPRSAAQPAAPKPAQQTSASLQYAGVPAEVVAAISAALAAALEGSSFRIRSIKPVGARRGRWGAADIVDATRPF